jgi:hypothetical protein
MRDENARLGVETTTAHRNTHLSMSLKRTGFADRDAIPWGALGSGVGDAVIGTQRGDTLARPAIAIAGHKPVPVQDAGDEIVVGACPGGGAGNAPAPRPM